MDAKKPSAQILLLRSNIASVLVFTPYGMGEKGRDTGITKMHGSGKGGSDIKFGTRNAPLPPVSAQILLPRSKIASALVFIPPISASLRFTLTRRRVTVNGVAASLRPSHPFSDRNMV